MAATKAWKTAAWKTRTSARRLVAQLVAQLVALAVICLAIVAARPAQAQYVGRVSSFVLDASSGRVLQQYNPDLQRYPASLTKLMTLYLTFRALRDDRITLDQAVPVSSHAASMEPSKLGLVPGSYLTVQQAILALVTKSANDAACALGEMLGGGSEQHFGQIMTQQAASLGMARSVFRNASGLPDPAQFSTARDFAMLARHLIRDFPDQYRYFSVPAFMFHGRFIGNHDSMLRTYSGADGLKTGYTADAGHNLVSSAVRGNVRLIGVVLGARTNPQRSAMMANLLDAGFQAEGVPGVAPPSPRRRPAMVLVSDETPDHASWNAASHVLAHTSWRRHHLLRHVARAGLDRHGRTHARIAGLHLTLARMTVARIAVRDGHRWHAARMTSARLRRVLAGSRRSFRLHLEAAASEASNRQNG